MSRPYRYPVPKHGAKVKLFTYIGEGAEPGEKQLAPLEGTVMGEGHKMVQSRPKKTYKVKLEDGREVEVFANMIVGQ